MQSNKLFIFVEGYSDKIFFENIILPRFKERYTTISVRMYANEKKQDIVTLIHDIKQANVDYIFVADKNSEYTYITTKTRNTQRI